MDSQNTKTTVLQAAVNFLESVQLSRSAQTHKAYRIGLNQFLSFLEEFEDLDPARALAESLDTRQPVRFVQHIQKRDKSAATQQLYATAVRQFYQDLVSEGLLQANLTNLQQQLARKTARQGKRRPPFPRQQVEAVLSYAASLDSARTDSERQRLINLRDRAFVLTLADTGLRVHEACGLLKGQVDTLEGRAEVVGKGNRQEVVRFSRRSLGAIRDYFKGREPLDRAAGRQDSALPLFARHDRRAGKQVRPISTETGRNIIKRLVRESLGDQARKTITPHTFRHYFVSIVMLATEGDIQITQELARHKSPQMTMRYAHLADKRLDKVYRRVFDEEET